MREVGRSEQACPVCSQHTLALDEPPRIDVMGVQLYSDIVGMGDIRPGSMGIVCLSCGTRWRDKAAFDRGEPEPEQEPGQSPEQEPDAGFPDEAWDEAADPVDDGAGDDERE